jgi:hypothetical protein
LHLVGCTLEIATTKLIVAFRNFATAPNKTIFVRSGFRSGRLVCAFLSYR